MKPRPLRFPALRRRQTIRMKLSPTVCNRRPVAGGSVRAGCALSLRHRARLCPPEDDLRSAGDNPTTPAARHRAARRYSRRTSPCSDPIRGLYAASKWLLQHRSVAVTKGLARMHWRRGRSCDTRRSAPSSRARDRSSCASLRAGCWRAFPCSEKSRSQTVSTDARGAFSIPRVRL